MTESATEERTLLLAEGYYSPAPDPTPAAEPDATPAAGGRYLRQADGTLTPIPDPQE